MCSLSAATRWRHSDNCYNGKDRKLGFLVTIYSLVRPSTVKYEHKNTNLASQIYLLLRTGFGAIPICLYSDF